MWYLKVNRERGWLREGKKIGKRRKTYEEGVG